MLAVATEVSLPVYLSSLSHKRLSDEALVELLADIGEQCVLLVEDVDRDNIITHVDSQEKRSVDDRDAVKASEIILGGLLDALDGPTVDAYR